MDSKPLRYIGPFDAVDIDLGSGLQVVKKGDYVSVPTGIAGVAPDPDLDRLQEELRDATFRRAHEEAAAIREQLIDMEWGSGLLAQTSSWVEYVPSVDGPALLNQGANQ